MVEDNSREVAASALSSLPTALYESPYKSPYPPADLATGDMTFNGQAVPSGTYEDSQSAASMVMTFNSPPAPAANMVNYMTPYG